MSITKGIVILLIIILFTRQDNTKQHNKSREEGCYNNPSGAPKTPKPKQNKK